MSDLNLLRVGLTMLFFSGPTLGFSFASGGLIFVPLSLFLIGFFMSTIEFELQQKK